MSPRCGPVEGGLEIKPGQSVALTPDSFHVMLIGFKQPFQQGQHVKGTLEFQKAGKLDVEFTVEPIGARVRATRCQWSTLATNSAIGRRKV